MKEIRVPGAREVTVRYQYTELYDLACVIVEIEWMNVMAAKSIGRAETTDGALVLALAQR